MSVRTILAFAFFLAFAAACQAAEQSKQDQPKFALPSAQLGDYSLKLDIDEPAHAGAPDPSALTPLRQQTIRPFVGLSLSRPISDKFWKFDR